VSNPSGPAPTASDLTFYLNGQPAPPGTTSITALYDPPPPPGSQRFLLNWAAKVTTGYPGQTLQNLTLRYRDSENATTWLNLARADVAEWEGMIGIAQDRPPYVHMPVRFDSHFGGVKVPSHITTPSATLWYRGPRAMALYQGTMTTPIAAPQIGAAMRYPLLFTRVTETGGLVGQSIIDISSPQPYGNNGILFNSYAGSVQVTYNPGGAVAVSPGQTAYIAMPEGSETTGTHALYYDSEGLIWDRWEVPSFWSTLRFFGVRSFSYIGDPQRASVNSGAVLLAKVEASIRPHAAGSQEYPGLPLSVGYHTGSEKPALLPIQSGQWHKLVLKVGPDAEAVSNGITLKLGTGEEGENAPQSGFSLQVSDTGGFSPLTIPADGKIEMLPTSDLYQKLTSPEGLTLFLKRDETVNQIHRLGLDLIPKRSTYLVQRVAALDMPPVDLTNIRVHAIPADDQAILGWDTSQDIAETNIAWIDAHTSASDATPRMPQLELRIPGLRQELTIQSKLEVQYNRGNGARTFRNQVADRVRIPADGSFQTADGDTWRIWESYAAVPFFGGEATLTYRIMEGQNEVLAPQTLRFRIGGRNPEPAIAREFIESLNNAGPQESLWFAYAIAKAESKDYNGADTRYNQFWQLPRDANDTNYRQSRITNSGRPLWGNDGGTSPGGYGMFQVTGTADSPMDDIPRQQIWNWQENTTAALAILTNKNQGAQQAMAARRQECLSERGQAISVPAHSVPRQGGDSGTLLGDPTDGATPNPRHTFMDADVVGAVAIKRYNGAAVPEGQSGAATGTGDYCVWRNQTANTQGRWEFRRWRVRNGEVDQVSYVDLVAGEIE
jgi:hypothetical protein